jgi:hypothetical protein
MAPALTPERYANPAAALCSGSIGDLAEWLCEMGDASGLQRGHADGRVVVCGKVDDRHRNPISLETMPQLDAWRAIVQIDVENNANCLFEIAVIFKSLCGRRQHTVVTVLP